MPSVLDVNFRASLGFGGDKVAGRFLVRMRQNKKYYYPVSGMEVYMSASDIQQVDDGDPVGWEAVRDLPPSAKLVAKVLEYNETLTQSQLADETLLPPRTVRYALNRLEEVGVVDSRFSFADARKRIYTLSIE